MRTCSTTVAAVFMLCALGHGTAHARSPFTPDSPQAPAAAPPAPAPATLAGTWRSAPYELPLASELETSVWGPGARSIRTVDLVVRPSGEGTVTVNTRVVDAKGRTQAASAAVEEAEIVIGEARPGVGPRTERSTTVVKAERRYPDDPSYRWSIDGLRITMATIDGQGPDSLEIRYDTPEGRGSFWDTLTRTTRGPAARGR